MSSWTDCGHVIPRCNTDAVGSVEGNAMPLLGHVTFPCGDRILTLPIVSLAYANTDAPRLPGGLFMDEHGHIGIAVDARAPAAAIEASVLRSAQEAAQALSVGDLN